MRIHHIGCGSLSPVARRFQQDAELPFDPPELVCHCMLIETDSSLVLVDTGLGLHDLALPQRIAGSMRALLRPHLDREDAAMTHVRRIGGNPSDVRDIVLTHLDFDSAGGLSDFPKARVHLLAAEYSAAHRRDITFARSRYRPAQWAHSPDWVVHVPGSGDEWFGLECIKNLPGLPPEILLVPLPGHTPGHTGVAVWDGEAWQLHAGDAYLAHSQMNVVGPSCDPGLLLVESMLAWEPEVRLDTQRRLRDLIRVHGADIDVFCSHDAEELERCRKREQVLTRIVPVPHYEAQDRPSVVLH